MESVVDTHTTQRYDFTLTDVPDTAGEEVVGYRMSGSGYSEFQSSEDANTVHDQTATGKRYDFVLTRHKKADFDDKLTEENSSYTIRNRETATVTPAGGKDAPTSAESTRDFTRRKAVFTPPVGNFDTGKQGGARQFTLTEFLNGKTPDQADFNAVTGLSYTAYLRGYQYAYTREGNGSAPENYGKKNVHVELTDDTVYFCGDPEPLTAADFAFESLSFSYTVQKARFDDAAQSFTGVTPEASDFDDTNRYLSLEVKDADGVWHQAARVDLATGALENVDSAYIASHSGTNLTFQKGVTGYRFSAESTFYYVGVTARPSLKLLRSERMLSLAATAQDGGAPVTNVAVTTARDSSDASTVHYTKSSSAVDTVYPEQRDSKIKKEVTQGRNNTVEKTFTVTWKASMSETLTLKTQEYVRQSSGVFWDLLPIGTEVDLDTVLVQSESGFWDPANYTATVQANYHNSGRTLLRVELADPADYYNVYFDTTYTWENLRAYGDVLYNPIVYKTGNDTIAKGITDTEVDIRSRIFHTNASALTGLDGEAEESKFLMAETEYKTTALVAATTGLDKKTRSETDAAFSYETVAEPGGVYAYQLNYSNGYSATAGGMVFYDNLEAYGAGEWKGVLESIDVSQLTAAGIAPKVYYSTLTDHPDYANEANGASYRDLTDASRWTPLEESQLANMGSLPITAIAIDMSKAADGSDFTLGEGRRVTAVLYMRAPVTVDAGARPPADPYPKTYNNIYIAIRAFDGLNEGQARVLEQDYTTVKYHITGSLLLYKYDTSKEGRPGIGGISFHITGVSDYGTPVDLVRNSSTLGNVAFPLLEKGTYYLTEDGDYPDWQADHTPRTITVDGDGETAIDGVIYGAVLSDDSSTVICNGKPHAVTAGPDEEGVVTAANGKRYSTSAAYPFGNTPRAHADITFQKTVLGASYPVPGARFHLYTAASDYGNEVNMFVSSDESGVVTFPNIERGTYTLTEVAAPEGFVQSDAVYTVTVDAEGNYAITADDLPAGAEESDYLIRSLSGEYTIPNERLHELLLYKVDETGAGLSGAEFTLTSAADKSVVYTAVSGDSRGAGSVLFEGLASGTYLLEETKAPEDHILSGGTRIVTIGKDGAVTIQGLTPDEDGYWNLLNYQEATTVQVLKRWQDNDPATRTDPVIAVSTEDPSITAGTVAVFKKVGENTWFDGPKSNLTGVKCFKRGTVSQKPADAVEIQDTSSEYPIYGWISGDTYYWATNARTAQVHPDTTQMFRYLPDLEEIDLTGIDTSRVRNFSSFFAGHWNQNTFNSPLKTVKGVLDMSSATSMNTIFANCFALSNLKDLTFQNTGKITNMASAFQSCRALTEIDLNTLDTSSATTMESMFNGCGELVRFSGYRWDTANVTSMKQMFDQCKKLASVGDVSHWNTSKVTNFNHTFAWTSLTSLNLMNWVTSSATDMGQMFADSWVLTDLKLSFDTSKVTNMSQMLYKCYVLKTLDLSSFVTNEATNMYQMFYNSASATVFISDGFTNNGNLSDGQNTYIVIEPTGPTTAIPSPPPGGYSRSTYGSSTSSGGASESETTWLSTGDYCTVDKSYGANEWLYTFTVTGTAAYAWEDAVPDNYELTESTYAHSTDLAIGSAEAPVELAKLAADDIATVTNKLKDGYIVPTFGSLALRKTLYLGTEETTSSDLKFTFTVTLRDGDGQPVTGTFGDATFVNGTATLLLSGGETRTLTDIPTGYAFTVSEAAGDYATTVTATNAAVTEGTTDVTGTIQANTASRADYTNTVTVDDREPMSFVVKKAVVNDRDRSYTFDAQLTDLKKDTTYILRKTDAEGHTTESTFTSYKNGDRYDGYVNFTLKNGESVEFVDIPTGSTYRITESGGESYTARYTVTNANEKGTIVSASSGAAAGASLSTAVETAEEGEETTVTFTNTERRSTQQLTLKKAVKTPVTNEAGTQDFTFEILFSNLGEGHVFRSDLGQHKADQEGNLTVTATLRSGGSVTFEGVPVDAGYLIRELDSGKYMPAYAITGGVHVASESGATLTAHQLNFATAQETVDVGEDAVVTFTNTLPTGALQVSKAVADGEAPNKEFSFTARMTYEGKPLAGTYTLVRYTAGVETGRESVTLVQPASGSEETFSTCGFTLKDGQSVELLGLPDGTVCTVEDDDPAGFIPEVTVTSEDGEHSTVYGTLAQGLTIQQEKTVTAAYTNHVGYALPQTGGSGTALRALRGLWLALSALALGAAGYERRRRV